MYRLASSKDIFTKLHYHSKPSVTSYRVKNKVRLSLLILTCSAILFIISTTVYAEQILVGSQLEKGYGMGVDSSEKRRDWLSNEGGFFRISYPKGQSWGAVFITVGNPTDPPRPFRNFMKYKTLQIEMKGDKGGETVSVGIKTNTQQDDGTETKKNIKLTKDWRIYRFPLETFKGTDTNRLYVVTEFVFEGAIARTTFLRSVSFKD